MYALSLTSLAFVSAEAPEPRGGERTVREACQGAGREGRLSRDFSPRTRGRGTMRLIWVFCALSSAWVANGQLLRYEGKVRSTVCVLYMKGERKLEGKRGSLFFCCVFRVWTNRVMDESFLCDPIGRLATNMSFFANIL